MHVLSDRQPRHADAPLAAPRPRRRPETRGDPPDLRTSGRKAVLFCPECGHESHVDGDWISRELPGRTDHECPVCGFVVVSQPTFPGSSGG